MNRICFLSSRHWFITGTVSCIAVTAVLESEPYDLKFMDQYMTSTERQLLRTDTVRALRASGFKNTICGLSANDVEQSFIRAGADCFVLKPIPCGTSALEVALGGILSSVSSDSRLFRCSPIDEVPSISCPPYSISDPESDD
jgi:hypothetical protein